MREQKKKTSTAKHLRTYVFETERPTAEDFLKGPTLTSVPMTGSSPQLLLLGAASIMLSVLDSSSPTGRWEGDVADKCRAVVARAEKRPTTKENK